MLKFVIIAIWIVILSLCIACIIISLVDQEGCKKAFIPDYETAKKGYKSNKFDSDGSRFVLESVASYKIGRAMIKDLDSSTLSDAAVYTINTTDVLSTNPSIVTSI